MTYGYEGLGKLTAADSDLASIDRTRFMSPNTDARVCAGYFTVAGGASDVRVRPVYVRAPARGSTVVLSDEPRWEDPSQEAQFTADGGYTQEFTARPGFLMTFKVEAIDAGSVDIGGQYLPNRLF